MFYLPHFVLFVCALGVVEALFANTPEKSQLLTLSLNGQWSASNANGSIVLNNSCSVPGDIYTDLQYNAIIGDPLAGYGDVTLRWIAYGNWTYYRRVEVPFLSEKRLLGAVLVFDGLQVVSEVKINGVGVGRSLSDFKSWEFDIGAILCPLNSTDNSFLLEVSFASSANYAETQFVKYPPEMVQPVCPAYLEDIDHRNFIRAEQSSFGWDWGPAFAPMGIYGNVSLLLAYGEVDSTIAIVAAIVPQVFSLPFKEPVQSPLNNNINSWQVELSVYIDIIYSTGTSVLSALVTSQSLGPSLISARCESCNAAAAINTTVKARLDCTLQIANASLWWPRGYGEQVRHDLKVVIFGDKTILCDKSILFGLRSAELLTHDDPLKGTTLVPNALYPHSGDDISSRPTMFFRVNGVPIFAKGANIIPYDPFRGRTSHSLVEDILQSVVLANMNMLRVWGGGLFKDDYFYNRCDELGILVWQEMMFACAEYPIDNTFLSLVRSEISYQLRRLSVHPSIILWSGNNEDEIYDQGPGSPYEVLDYGTVLYQIIREDSSRPIWPSSPSIGFSSGTTSSGLPAGTTMFPSSFSVGKNDGGSDTHYYNYFKCPDIASFPKTNFGSEYGFQSLPWLDNIEPVSTPADWSLFSDWMNHRQHHPDGNNEIYLLMKKNFADLPDPNVTDVSTFKRIIYLSQLQQVLCLAEETAFYRRGRNMPYRTMGALYWQLNQNWQAPSWTSMEYGGEWKILHYAMSEAFLPLRITAYINVTTSTIVAHVLNDHREDLGPFTVQISVIPLRLDNGVPSRSLFETLQIAVIPGLSGAFVWTVSMDSLLSNISHFCPSVSNCFLQFALQDSKGNSASPLFDLWLASLTTVSLDKEAKVQITGITLDDPSHAVLDVSLRSATGPAVYVFLRSLTYRGYFSKNLLTLVAQDKPTRLTFTARSHVSDGKRTAIHNLTDFISSIEWQNLN